MTFPIGVGSTALKYAGMSISESPSRSRTLPSTTNPPFLVAFMVDGARSHSRGDHAELLQAANDELDRQPGLQNAEHGAQYLQHDHRDADENLASK